MFHLQKIATKSPPVHPHQVKAKKHHLRKITAENACAKINNKFAKTANFRAILHMASSAHRKDELMEGEMSTLPVTHLDRIVMNTTPVLHGTMIKKLRQLLTNRMIHARMARSHREVVNQLSTTQLHDVGLERVFDGQQWKLQMIDSETTQDRR